MDQNKIKELEAQIEQYKKESLQNLEKMLNELINLKTKPTELVRSWEESYNKFGYYLNCNSHIKIDSMPSISADPEYKCLFRTEAQAKSALAFAQLSHIVADANGDWVADWADENQRKYIVECTKGVLLPSTRIYSECHLPMKSFEIRDACLEKHRTLWEDFWMMSK